MNKININEFSSVEENVNFVVKHIVSERKKLCKEYCDVQHEREVYRVKLKEASNDKEAMFMKIFKPLSNRYAPLLIDEKLFYKNMQKSNADELIIISSWQNNMPDEKNYDIAKDFLKDIKESRYQYLPIYNDYVLSFIIYNVRHEASGYGVDQCQAPLNVLRNKGIEWAKKYNQNCILIKKYRKGPLCVDKNGKQTKVNDNFMPLFLPLENENVIEKRLIDLFAQKYNDYKNICIKNQQTPDTFSLWYDKQNKQHDFINKNWTYDIMNYDKNVKAKIYVNPFPINMVEAVARKNEYLFWWM